MNHNGSVDFFVNNSQTDGTGSLASAGPLFFDGPNGFRNGFVFDHATTGVDPAVGASDATARFDFGYNWNSGLGAPSGSQYDLFSVALHEVTHSLGFLSLVESNGVSGISGGDPGVFSVFDTFLERGDGTKLFGTGGNYLGTSADLISNDVFFDGPNATAANGGTPVKIYAPTTFNDGSSISHVQFANAVMQFSMGAGTQRRTYTPQEIGVLQDLGWQVQAIPEPSSLALMSLAIAGVASCRKRVRRSTELLPESVA